MVETNSEANTEPQATIAVDTPQRVSKETFAEDVEQLTAELAILSVKLKNQKRQPF